MRIKNGSQNDIYMYQLNPSPSSLKTNERILEHLNKITLGPTNSNTSNNSSVFPTSCLDMVWQYCTVEDYYILINVAFSLDMMLICIFYLQKPPEREDLGEFLYVYLQRRFGVENMIIEWGYNLYDACNRYNHDPRIGLFYGILQKEVWGKELQEMLIALEMCTSGQSFSWILNTKQLVPHMCFCCRL